MLQVIVRNLGVRSEYGKKKKKPSVGFEREVTFGFSRITSVAVLRFDFGVEAVWGAWADSLVKR